MILKRDDCIKASAFEFYIDDFYLIIYPRRTNQITAYVLE